MPSQRPYSKPQEASCISHECDDCRQIIASQGQTTMRLFKNALVRRNKTTPIVPNYGTQKAPSTISITSFDSKDLHLAYDSDDMTSPASSPGSRPQSSRGPRKSTSEEPPRDRHQPRRPTLKQILADEAEAPWTLAAFTQYAAQNMCLENIQFIQDTRKYTKAYDDAKKPAQTSAKLGTATSQPTDGLKDQWSDIIATYVIPSSPREINIPGDVRAALAKVSVDGQAPAPEHLKPAVAKVLELLEDSILFSFFNETRPQGHLVFPEHAAPELGNKRRPSPLLDSSTVTFAPEAIVRRPKASNLNFQNLSISRPGQQSPNRATSHGHAASSSSSVSAMASPSAYTTSYSSYTAWTDHPEDESSVTSPSTLLSPTTTTGQSSTPPITPPPSEHELSVRRASPRSRSESTGWQKFNKLFKKNSHSSGLKKAHRGSESAIEEE